MGFWSKTTTTLQTKTKIKTKTTINTAIKAKTKTKIKIKTNITRKSHKKLTQKNLNQRICPLIQEEKHQYQNHPPTLNSMQRPKQKYFLKVNQQKSRHKAPKKQCQIHDKNANVTTKCHCTKQQQHQQEQQEQKNFTFPNEVTTSHFSRRLIFEASRVNRINRHRAMSAIYENFRNIQNFRKYLDIASSWCWKRICLNFLLLLSCSSTCMSTKPTMAITTGGVAYAAAAFVTFTTTMASVSGAAVAYANGATIYDTDPFKLANAANNNNNNNINSKLAERNQETQGEPGEELMYAYYKRAQRHQQQQRHLHQHATPVQAETSQEFNFDDSVPTLDVVTVLAANKEFAPRPQKRSGETLPAASTSKPPTPTSTPRTIPTTSTTTTTTRSTTNSSPHSSSSSNSNNSSSTSTSSPDDEKCEPKVLDEVPTEPFYDFSDVAEDAARQFAEFLAIKFPGGPPPPRHNISDELRQEITRRAHGIASNVVNEDSNLLAFAIAAPSVHTVVLKFRSYLVNIRIPPEQAHNKSFLGSYWRELTYAWNSTDGSQEWGAPFRDCNILKKRWLWPYRISYAENKFKIVAAAFIAADEDVCNDGLEEVFGRRQGCDRNTTFCLLTENKPNPTRDVYSCICRESFYLPNSTLQGFRGDVVEMSEGYDNYSCIPCPGGCSHCDQNGECLLLGEPPEVVSMESLMKVSVGSVLGGCILCCVVLSVIVFRQRKSKAIATGMWTVLETILLGIILLYASVAVHFFPASTERCLIEPWLRELGFIIFYGAIILKLYRHLVDFRTRKAHRWVLRDVDLLKYLGTMVFAVLCYLSGFTAASLDLLESAQLESLRETSTNTCLPLKWDYITQTSEILVLCFGLHLSFASRNANTQFRERQFLVATLVLEFIVSTTFYVLRFIYLQEMSPSTIFLALFVRSQLTNTISLGLIFVPKLWYQHKQVRSLAHDLSIRLPVDAFKGSHDVGQRLGGGYAGLCLGDPDIGELTISEMSPEDIRAELKRLYTQLEILKNKTLRQDNPHISKRRGGRKAGHRRFSLQALSAKHRNKHHQDLEITEAEPSRTPEDSVCSVEGPTDAEISGISHSMLSHSAISHSVVSHSK